MTDLNNRPVKPLRHLQQIEIFPPGANAHPETRPELRLDFGPSFAELSANPPAELYVPSAENAALEPSALRGQVRLMVALLWQLMGARGAVSMAAKVKTVLRQLYEEEKQAMTLWAKQALRRSPDWQAQVFEDLGGAAGLSRWQSRLTKSYHVEPEDDYAWLDDDPEDWPIPDAPAPRARPRKKTYKVRPRFKTDRDGLFRWASIKLGRRAPSGRSRYFEDTSAEFGTTFFQESRRRKTFADPWPIEVLPSDLIDSHDFEDEDHIDITLDPLTLWEAMQAEHHHWYEQMTEFLQRIRSGAMLLVPP